MKKFILSIFIIVFLVSPIHAGKGGRGGKHHGKDGERVKIYDENSRWVGTVENGRIYDQNYRFKGTIQKDKFYDEKSNFKGYIEKQKGK